MTSRTNSADPHRTTTEISAQFCSKIGFFFPREQSLQVSPDCHSLLKNLCGLRMRDYYEADALPVTRTNGVEVLWEAKNDWKRDAIK